MTKNHAAQNHAPEKCFLQISGASVIISIGSAISGRTWRVAAPHAPVKSVQTTQHSRTKRLRRDPIIPTSPRLCKSIVQDDFRLLRRPGCGRGVSASCHALILSAVLSVCKHSIPLFVFPAKARGRVQQPVPGCGPEGPGDRRT